MKPDGISQERWDRGVYWNPWQLVDGCTKVKAGCKNCWSLDAACRFKQDFVKDDEWSAHIQFNYDRVNVPHKTRKPTIFAVWNDLFHAKVKQEDICHTFQVMRDCPQHTFLILTKRIKRVAQFIGLSYTDNIWLGTSVSTQEDADKNIPELLNIPATLWWLSIEPLLSPIDLSRVDFSAWETTSIVNVLTGEIVEDSDVEMVGTKEDAGIGWVVVGCESSPKRRPCKLEWVRNVVEQCKSAGVAVFVKQLNIGGKVVKDITKFPKELRLREWPMSGAGKR